MELKSGRPDGLCVACLLEAGLASTEPVSAQAAPSPDGTSAAARVLGDYELLEEIAQGGMGMVYKARQRSLGRIVALKTVLAGRLARSEDVARFRLEAEAAANLQHPNIVAIHEVNVHDGQHFFSMDYVEGRSLAALVRDGPLPAAQAAGYVEKIARAVHYAHERGVLHRDLKPSNVLIDAQDEPHVTDFGLAKRLDSTSDLTLSGQVLGTPSFMPPEQAAGQRAQMGPGSDVYSLGAILYQLLTGRPPFVGTDAHAVLAQAINSEVVAPRLLNPAAPRDLETIALKCLEKEPARRYATALALAADLAHHLNHEPILAVPPSAVYRARKFVQRHRLAVSAAAVFILLLTTATLVSVTFGIRANQQRTHAVAAERAAKKNEQEAKASEENAQALLSFLRTHLLNAGRPKGESGGLGHDVTLRAAIDSAASNLATAFTRLPKVAAIMRSDLGDTYRTLGDYSNAIVRS